MSKDSDSNVFLQLGLESYWDRKRNDSLMLDTSHVDTWNMLNIQHIALNVKRWDYSDILTGVFEKIKRPVHMVEGAHHLRERPTPTWHLLQIYQSYWLSLSNDTSLGCKGWQMNK